MDIFTIIGFIASFIALGYLTLVLLGLIMMSLHMTGFSVGSIIVYCIATPILTFLWFITITALPISITLTQ